MARRRRKFMAMKLLLLRKSSVAPAPVGTGAAGATMGSQAEPLGDRSDTMGGGK